MLFTNKGNPICFIPPARKRRGRKPGASNGIKAPALYSGSRTETPSHPPLRWPPSLPRRLKKSGVLCIMNLFFRKPRRSLAFKTNSLIDGVNEAGNRRDKRVAQRLDWRDGCAGVSETSQPGRKERNRCRAANRRCTRRTKAGERGFR